MDRNGSSTTLGFYESMEIAKAAEPKAQEIMAGMAKVRVYAMVTTDMPPSPPPSHPHTCCAHARLSYALQFIISEPRRERMPAVFVEQDVGGAARSAATAHSLTEKATFAVTRFDCKPGAQARVVELLSKTAHSSFSSAAGGHGRAGADGQGDGAAGPIVLRVITWPEQNRVVSYTAIRSREVDAAAVHQQLARMAGPELRGLLETGEAAGGEVCRKGVLWLSGLRNEGSGGAC
jgi:hypothetical protein